MSDSEAQFQELLAHLIARVDKMLTEQGDMQALGLTLHADGRVEVAVGLADSPERLSEVLNAMQTSFSQAVLRQPIKATCIAYPDYEKKAVIALLENDENYCSRITIPVLTNPTSRLDVDGIEVEDGGVYIFRVMRDT